MKNIISLLYVLLLFLVFQSAYSQDISYTMTEISDFNSFLYVNESDLVVGRRQSVPALWDQGTVTILGMGSMSTAFPFAINLSGDIVGSVSNSSQTFPVIWNNLNLSLLDSAWGRAHGINNSGQTVGYVRLGIIDEAVVWNNGVRTILFPGATTDSKALDLNNSGVISGVNNAGAFIYNNGSTTTYGQGEEATAINNNNQIVGFRFDSQQNEQAFTTDVNGNFITLSALPGFPRSRAVALNDNGEVVGSSTTSSNDDTATLWTAQYDVVKLEDKVLNFSGWDKLIFATDINNNGTIVGVGRKTNGSQHGFLLTPALPAVYVLDNSDSGADPGPLWIPIYSDITFFIPGLGRDWDLLSDTSDNYGQDYYSLSGSENTGEQEFTWSFSVDDSGTYNVEAWWPTTSNTTFNASFEIENDIGTSTIVFSQASNAGQWNSLGNYYFVEGVTYDVTVTAPTGEKLIADAIRVSN